MTNKKFNLLIKLMTQLREEISTLLYAGVSPELICKIPSISTYAVGEIALQIRVKEERLFNINRVEEVPTLRVAAKLVRRGVPLPTVKRKYCDTLTDEDLLNIARVERHSYLSEYLTYQDMIKRVEAVRLHSDDMFFLFCQLGGLVYPFKRLDAFSNTSKLNKAIDLIKSVMPSNNKDILNQVTFFPMNNQFEGTREPKPLAEFDIQGNYSQHLSVKQRIKKLNLLSAIHGVEVLARETKLSEELVTYLLNKRLVETVCKTFKHNYQYKSSAADYPELYNNTYQFNEYQPFAINSDYYVLYHLRNDRYFDKRKLTKVVKKNMPFDLLAYLTRAPERTLANHYYTDRNELDQVKWMVPFTSASFEHDFNRVSAYVMNQTKDKFYLELTNLSRQVEFNLRHIKVGKELLNILSAKDADIDTVHYNIMEFSTSMGISLNDVSSYVAPVYILTSGKRLTV